MEDETSRTVRLRQRIGCFFMLFFIAGIVGLVVFGFIKLDSLDNQESPVPKIELASMDFTVLNITQTRLSAKWDMSIRIPDDLPSWYICLQGDFQALFLYKNVTLATSSPLKYYNLERNNPQLLKISAVVSEEDIGGLIGKELMEDIKEKKEVQFGSKFSLTDCREKTTGVMSYACNEVTLRFEPGSEMKATMFGNHPNCINV